MNEHIISVRLNATHAWLFASVANCFLFALCLVALFPGFETNDDPAMMFFASGFITGEQNAHIIYSNVAVGWFLKLLYSLTTKVNWYPAFLYGVHFISSVVFFRVLLGRQPLLLAIFIFTVVFFLFETALLQQLQFTSTAFMCGIAGFLYWFYQLEVRRQSMPGTLAAMAMALTCGLIRWHVFGAVVVLFVPVLLARFGYRRFFQTAPWLLLLFALFSFAQVVDYQIHKHHRSTNILSAFKGGETDPNDPLNLSDEALHAAGFLRVDAELFKAWFGIDRDVFTREKMSAFAKASHSRASGGKALRRLSGALRRDARYLLVAVVIVIAAAFFLQRRRDWMLLALFAASAVTVAFCLAMFMRLPHRVLFPLSIAVAQYAVFSMPFTMFGRLRLRYGALGVMIGISLVIQTDTLTRIKRENRSLRAAFIERMSLIGEQHDKIVIVRGGCFPFEGAPLAGDITKYNTRHNFLITGACVNTPVYNRFLEQQGIRNLAPALFERDDLYILGYLDCIREFLEVHYHLKLVADTVMAGPMSLTKLKRAE